MDDHQNTNKNMKTNINETANEKKIERAILVGVHKGLKNVLDDSTDESLDELARLADTAGAEAVAIVIQNREHINTATYVGKGKVEEIKALSENMDANLVIFDGELSGSQVRNLEKIIGLKVIDRSTLIMDIFAARANTKEGKIQVELAQLKYILPRLIGIGASLSRLGGGIGTRGPGETQLETDRRHIRRRIGYLEDELKEIQKHRELLRIRRKKDGLPVIALVGYTNAGKSSLMNVLTNENVFVEDKLFATLDPTIRGLTLSENRNALLVDTVGFIRKLPHHLIKAFKSTLEEAVLADVLLHVVDSSSKELLQHIEVVDKLLSELGALDKPTIMVYNKIDLIKDTNDILPTKINGNQHSVEVSAHTKQGLDQLLLMLDDVVPGKKQRCKVCIPYTEGKLVSQIHEICDVLNEEYRDNGTYMEILVDHKLSSAIQNYICE